MGNTVTYKIVLDNDDNDVFHTKSWVQGKFVVEVHSSAPVKGEPIKVELEGTEFAHIHVGGCLRTEGRGWRDLIRENKTFKNKAGKDVKAGTYDFPFKFYLNGKLPASCGHRSSNANEAYEIKYILTATIGDGIRMRKEREITVYTNPMVIKSNPVTKGPSPVEVKRFWFPVFKRINKHIYMPLQPKKGFVLFAASVDNSNVGKGQTVTCHVTLQNQSSIEIESVDVRIVQRAFFTQDELAMAAERNRTQERILGEELNVEFASFVTKEWPDKHLPDKLENDVKEKMRSELTKAENMLQFEIPEDALDTYPGTLLRMSHVLQVVTKMEKCVDDPTFEIPLTVGETEATLTKKLPASQINFDAEAEEVDMDEKPVDPAKDDDDKEEQA